MTIGKWEFNYYDMEKKMSDKELGDYQKKLLELRDQYEARVEHLSNCHFVSRDAQLPPTDNLFASFNYECKRHRPKCQGWYILWNPNSDVNRSKLNASISNKCATWEFKAISKRIQYELFKAFPKYFEFYDDDDTHPYYIDSFYNLNYGFRSEDDEFPDNTSFSLNDRRFSLDANFLL